MKRMKQNGPPVTSNTLAQRLIKSAQQDCAGCRTNWRLKTGTFKHTGTLTECSAVEQRQALRDIAARRAKT